MFITDEVRREERSINDIGFSILDRCLAFFGKIWPEQDDEIFFTAYDSLMSMQASGDNAYAQVKIALKNRLPIDMNKAALLITKTYVVEALQADLRGETVLAERLLMDASFWCGLMWSGQEIFSAKKSAVAKYNEKHSQGRRNERWKNRDAIKDAVCLYVENRGKEKMWDSCANAARIVHIKLNEIIEEFKLEVGPWRPIEETIREWLLVMPNADQLFKTKA